MTKIHLNPKDSKIGVLGSGSFATAIVKMLLENSKVVHWCVKDENVKNAIKTKGYNPKYLMAVHFDVRRLKLTTNINSLVSRCDIIILATPSLYLSGFLDQMTCSYMGKIFISAIKGIIPKTNTIVAHYLKETYGIELSFQGVIAGPCHAEEVAMEKLSYLTIATGNDWALKKIPQLFSSDFIKVHTSADVLGNEYSAILKNIYAIGAGISNGLNYGDNFIAIFISNAIREMEVFLKGVYDSPRDVKESAYLGDLLVTAYSLFSRNRSLGNLIGKGYTVKSAIQSMKMIAEGYYATDSIYKTSQSKKLKTPIIKTLYKILYEEKNPEKEFKKLTQIFN
ncbi:MAG: glycerol-3-phosphate dehydrogenase [Bergeyella sp.]|nr:glycerol-3-phosphate dehydrogenase [Bergeyella sp.]